VEAVIAVHEARTTRVVARELDRRLDGLGARVGEEHLVETARRGREQPLGEDPRERRDVHLHEARQLALEHLAQRGDERRVVAADREHAEARQQVEILLALVVVEIGTVRAHVVAVEADRLEHAHVLRVQVALVEIELLALALANQLQDALGHSLAVLARGMASVA
jgi:hypothetical protein